VTTLKKIAIIALLLLGACSSQEYIFDSIDVKVVKAKKITGKHAGSWYTEYELETDSPSPTTG